LTRKTTIIAVQKSSSSVVQWRFAVLVRMLIKKLLITLMFQMLK